ncbi:MAG TPA: META domain-containing protein, partial [Acidimicrobiia bacterium]|nr:META domain-containing protein [Acidimicrobiia bacterium]
MDSTRDPPGQWADRTIGEGLPRTFTRRWVVLPSRSSRRYRPADWVDTLVVVGRGEVEIECVGGTRQRFGAGEILFLDGLPLRALHGPGPGSTLLIAVSRRSSRRRRSVPEMDDHSLDGTAWVVTVVDGAKVEGAARNSIRFGDGRVVGQVGINRFSATCVFADGRVTVGPIMSTLMAGPEATMELESSLLGALEGEHPFWIEGSNLFIGAVASGIALRRLGPAPVAGTV